MSVSAIHERIVVSDGDVTPARVVRSEWAKLWSLRSTRWSFLAAVVFMAGIGILIALAEMGRWAHLSAHDKATLNGVDVSLGGFHVAQLAIGVLGVMIISGEYTTGMIRSSMTAVPHRLPVLWAKMAVFSATTFVTMLVSSFVAFFAAQAILTRHHVDASLGDPHALRAIVGCALFLTVVGILCTALGAIVRNTAGGISTFVGILFVLPGVTAILPSSLGDAIDPYLPSSAGSAVAQVVPDGGTLAPWTGFAIFCGYTLIAVVAAAVLMRRRDV
jgi:ABC-type transport system involved in multi-copper enzyme maturation permease subunit